MIDFNIIDKNTDERIEYYNKEIASLEIVLSNIDKTLAKIVSATPINTDSLKAQVKHKEETEARIRRLQHNIEIVKRQADEAKHSAELAVRLREDYLRDDIPDEVAAKLYSYAYAEGHSAGDSDIESYYSEMATVFEEIFDLGRSSAR